MVKKEIVVEIVESEASEEVEQYALEMAKRAMKEFSEQEVNAMAAFVRD